MVVALCFVHVLNVEMRRITLPQESFRANCFGLVSWLAIMFGPKHGEREVMMEDGDEEENNDDNYRSMFPEYADTAMKDNEEEGQGEERAPYEPADDLGWVISDARRGCDTEKERLQFEQMLQGSQQIVVPNL
jgi:hypothetical protein